MYILVNSCENLPTYSMNLHFLTVIKEEPITNNNLNSKDIPYEIDSNHIAIENNLSDAAFSDDDEEQVPNSRFLF